MKITDWDLGYSHGRHDAKNGAPHRFPQGSREDDYLAGYDAGYNDQKGSK